MKTFIRLFRCSVALVLGALSLFGCLASFEPSETFPVHLGWLVGYSTVLLACIGTLGNDLRRLIRTGGRGALGAD